MRHDSVLVTGCSSGIGRATAEEFLDRGWRVYASARDTADVEELEREGAVTLELDVTVDGDCERAVEAVVRDHGSIDCLVNNAGYGLTATVEDAEPGEVHNQFDVNVYGPHRLMRETLPKMREQQHGTVVNMSSVGGLVSQPGIGVYCASKHALEALSDAARVEVADWDVDVVLVEPGPVDTSFEDRADDGLERRIEDGGEYADLYRGVRRYNRAIQEGGDGVGTRAMSRLTVPPGRVASVVADAAESPSPKPRYRVSPGHDVMAMLRYMPDGARDRLFGWGL
ncbi:MAG: SDR family oxidoreductase [Halobacteriota archaeon]